MQWRVICKNAPKNAQIVTFSLWNENLWWKCCKIKSALKNRACALKNPRIGEFLENFRMTQIRVHQRKFCPAADFSRFSQNFAKSGHRNLAKNREKREKSAADQNLRWWTLIWVIRKFSKNSPIRAVLQSAYGHRTLQADLFYFATLSP